MHMSVLGISRPREWPRLRFGGAATFVAGTLLAAGAIHICAILLVPMFARSDGWSRLVPFAGEDKFAEIPLATSGQVAGLDPLFVTGACRLDLSDAPAGITVDARERFWSVALYDPSGVIVFSLNDRTALEGRLDMIVVDPAQNAKLKQSPSEEIEQTIVVESQSDDLIALLRLFAPTRTAQEDARRILARAECLPAPSVVPTPGSDG
jgi:uncharacterized membrane protein